MWDLLAAYGKTPPPDRAAEGNDLVDFLMHQARLGQPSPADVGTLWHRLMIIWFIGGLMLWYWWYTVAG